MGSTERTPSFTLAMGSISCNIAKNDIFPFANDVKTESDYIPLFDFFKQIRGRLSIED